MEADSTLCDISVAVTRLYIVWQGALLSKCDKERYIHAWRCTLTFQGILDRLNAHKRDLEALNRAAQDMMEVDEAGCAMKEIQDLIERFEALQKNITEKREFFQRVTGKWFKFAEQKHKMNAFFKNTHGIVNKRQVKNADDCKKQIEECKVAELVFAQTYVLCNGFLCRSGFYYETYIAWKNWIRYIIGQITDY